MEKCWLYDNCSKVDCDKEFCLRQFKLNKLYELTLLSDKHKEEISLRLDADGRDRDSFLFMRDKSGCIILTTFFDMISSPLMSVYHICDYITILIEKVCLIYFLNYT